MKTLIVALVLALSSARGESNKITRTDNDLMNLSTQVQMFRVRHGRLPTSEEGLDILVENRTGVPKWRRLLDNLPLDSWGKPYQYVLFSKPPDASIAKDSKAAEFGLFSFGPDGMSATKGNDPDDINSWDPAKGWSDPSSIPNWTLIGWATALSAAFAALVWTLVRGRRR